MNLVFNKYLLPSQPYYNILEYLVAWKPTLTPSDLDHIKQQLLLLFKLTKPNNAISPHQIYYPHLKMKEFHNSDQWSNIPEIIHGFGELVSKPEGKFYK